MRAVAADHLVLDADAPAAAAIGAPALSLTLAVALLKFDKMDWVIQKATELGVTTIVPLSAARSVVRLDERRGGERTRRWQKIAAEAARQSGRADVPTVSAPITPAEAFTAAPATALRLILHEGARAAPLAQALPDRAAAAPTVHLAIGPEGGFSAAEVAAATAAAWHPVGLGPRILRAETAAVAAVALLGFALGDVGA